MRPVREGEERQYRGPVIVCRRIFPFLSADPRLNLRSSEISLLAGMRHLLVSCWLANA